jgi:hypothetical protein
MHARFHVDHKIVQIDTPVEPGDAADMQGSVMGFAIQKGSILRTQAMR